MCWSTTPALVQTGAGKQDYAKDDHPGRCVRGIDPRMHGNHNQTTLQMACAKCTCEKLWETGSFTPSVTCDMC